MQWWFDRRGSMAMGQATEPAPGWQRNLLQLARSRRLLVVAVALVVAAAVWWWRVGRGPEVTAVVATRGTAVEIVYATGAVEPLRWARVTSLVRNRILEVCYCEGKTVARGDVLA